MAAIRKIKKLIAYVYFVLRCRSKGGHPRQEIGGTIEEWNAACGQRLFGEWRGGRGGSVCVWGGGGG